MLYTCAKFRGLSLSVPASQVCHMHTAPSVCDTLLPSHPGGHTHLLPQAHRVIIPALLESPTHIVSLYEYAAHWLLSRVKSVSEMIVIMFPWT